MGIHIHEHASNDTDSHDDEEEGHKAEVHVANYIWYSMIVLLGTFINILFFIVLVDFFDLTVSLYVVFWLFHVLCCVCVCVCVISLSSLYLEIYSFNFRSNLTFLVPLITLILLMFLLTCT